jgi:hypothetical protein
MNERTPAEAAQKELASHPSLVSLTIEGLFVLSMQNLTVDVKNESCEEEQTVSGPQIVPAADHATEMQGRINKPKPIFVVGSPRSGTSILTWCLGQHPNILTVEESAGIGDLTIALDICYQVGTARGDHSLLSSIDVGKEEFFSAFGETINQLILRHRVDLDRKRWQRSAGPNAVLGPRTKAQLALNPKARWVDGTPLYSFYICGLRKLFPHALFIHIVRDVTSSVRSMLNFHRLAGVSLIANEDEAYDFWFRATSACLLAEQAYGPEVVFRLQYRELVDRPEASLRALLDFLGEPYDIECLIPLQKKINSSKVPHDFKLGHPNGDPEIVKHAIQLWADIESTPQPSEASPVAANEIEKAFKERVQAYRKAGERVEREGSLTIRPDRDNY